MSGELAQSVIGSMEYDYSQKDDALEYYTLLSIDNALPNDLANIGLWIGMPWPTASTLLVSGNAFTLTAEASFPQYAPTIGFGSVNNPATGGLFTSVTPSDITTIPIDKYRGLLKWYAIFKRDGFTIKALDDLAMLFSALYSIDYVSNSTFTLAPGSVTTSDPDRGLAPADLSTGGHFIAGGAWDINLHFNETIGAGNVYVLQYIFDSILDAQRVTVSQAI
jgi:hypothetical protein